MKRPALAGLLLIAPFVMGGASPTPAPPTAAPPLAARPALAVQKTEEGQAVIYDAYTWRRRELAKRLPLFEPWPGEGAIGAAFRRFGLDAAPMPETLPTPARIMGDVYLVNAEPNLTYLIDAGPGRLVLIDPGIESNVEPILRAVAALGFSPRDIR